MAIDHGARSIALKIGMHVLHKDTAEVTVIVS